MFDYEEMASRLTDKYIKTQKGYDRLYDDLKEIYNHQFFEGFEVVIDNLMSGAYDSGKNLKSVTEFEFELMQEEANND